MDYSKLVQASAPSPETTTSKDKGPLGLDFLDTLQEAERIDYELPFEVIFTFSPKKVNGRIVGIENPRFYTSSLKGARFEVAPYFDAGTMISAKSGTRGKLVVNCAKQESMFEVVENEEGHKAISFKAKPRFVSFNGEKAIRYSSGEDEGINALELLKAVQAAKEAKAAGEQVKA